MKQKSFFRSLLPLYILILLILACDVPSCNCPSCFPDECTPTRFTGTGWQLLAYQVKQVGGCREATVTYEGNGRIKIWISISDDTPGVVLVDEFGDYTGDFAWIPQVDYLVVDTDGSWSIDIK